MVKTAKAVRIPAAHRAPAGTAPQDGRPFRRDVAGPRVLPLLLSLSLVLLVAGAAACAGAPPPAPRRSAPPAPRIPLADVLAAVRRAPAIRALPADLTPSPTTAGDDLGFDNDKCEAGPEADHVDACVFGDPASSTKVVLYGDSQAGMWLPALAEIARRRHWQLRLFGKPACPAVHLALWSQRRGRLFAECDRFRAYAEGQILAERPGLVLVASESYAQKADRGVPVTPDGWRAGLTGTLGTLRRSGARVVVIGETPVLDESAPDCLAAHPANVAACATTEAAATARVWNAADQAAARATGSEYVSVLPWLCTAICAPVVCAPVVGNVLVYRNRFHLTATYARLLTGVLEGALPGVTAGDAGEG